MFEPTQADREAYLSLNMLPEFDAADVRAGRWDHITGVQAFARHRQATEQAIIAWLNDMKREDTNWPQVIARMIAEGQHRG